MCELEESLSSRRERRQFTYLSRNRCHRKLTGASTLTSKKKGRIRSLSRTDRSQMSVVTQRSVHRLVTKSSNESTDSNLWPLARPPTSDLCRYVSLSGSSETGAGPLFANSSHWKPCSRIRYSAMACFPAQMPFQDLVSSCLSFLCRMKPCENVLD